LRLAIVLWTGFFGGAESQMMALGRGLRELGHRPGFLFVQGASRLEARLASEELPSVSLGLSRGAKVLLHPRRFAAAAEAIGADGALLVSVGYLGAALKAGGYAGRVVAVEHGALGQLAYQRPVRRYVKTAERALGARTADVEVAVSDFMAEKALSAPHASRLVRIHHGVDAAEFKPMEGGSPASARVTIGVVSRLAAGKGIEALLHGFAGVPPALRGRLLIAGSGPLREQTEALSRDLGIAESTEFIGWVRDIPRFWGRCDVAVVPSVRPEAFGMTALEAMACGKPLIATSTGGLPEVAGTEAGIILGAAEPRAITEAIVRYAQDPSLRESHAAAARRRALRDFDLGICAERYATLFAHPLDALPHGFSRAEDL
jgi:glycosyltransferase involved in cell wall biosynthesis